MRTGWGLSKRWNSLVLVTDWMCGWDGEKRETNIKDNSQIL